MSLCLLAGASFSQVIADQPGQNPFAELDQFSDSIRERAALGLPTDDKSMAAAISDTEQRAAAGHPELAGTYLTNEESAQFARRQGLDELLRDQQPGLQKQFPEIIQIGASRSLADPHPTVFITDEVTKELTSGIELSVNALVPSGIGTLEFVRVPARIEELSQLEVALRTDLESFAKGDKTSLTAQIEALGATGPTVSIDFETAIMIVTTQRIIDNKTQQSVEQAVNRWVESLLGRALAVTVETVGPATPLSDRLDNPGQSAGGLRIMNNYSIACTTGFAMNTINGTQVTTAGHCGDVNSVWTHQSQTLGSTSVCRNYDPSPTGCSANTSAFGVDVSLIDPPIDGYASEYAFIDPVGSGPGATNYRLRLTGYSASSSIASTTWACVEGSSSFRITYAITFDSSCGYGTSSSSGWGRMNATVCKGDSGGIVRSGSQILGIAHAGVSPIAAWPSCYSMLEVSLASKIIANLSTLTASPITGSGSISVPKPATKALLQNSFSACIGASGSSWANGTAYVQWGCIPNAQAQSYGFEPVPAYGPDAFLLVRWDGTNRTCLSVSGDVGGGIVDGAPVISWDCLAGNNTLQVWRLTWNPKSGETNGQDGWLRITSIASGKCLSVPNWNGLPNGDPTWGLQMIIWGCVTGHRDQRWRLWQQ
jgi:hypothetical protein